MATCGGQLNMATGGGQLNMATCGGQLNMAKWSGDSLVSMKPPGGVFFFPV